MMQWLRKCSLVVAGESEGIELSDLAIRFTVYHNTYQSPSGLNARVYNLADATSKRIRKEFTKVILKAGYSNQDGEIFGTIFQGYIIQARAGRESPTETYLDIVAGDGDFGYTFAGLSRTLAAGYNAHDVKQEISKSFADYQITTGHEAEMPDSRYPRGRVLFGNTRDIARNLAFTTGHTWGIVNGKYQTVPLRGVLPGEEIVLNSQTGLLGLPEETQDGIRARCLLNPYIWHDRIVRIDNASIQGLPLASPPTAQGVSDWTTTANYQLSSDGRYRVIFVDHVGNTRGNEWFTDMVLLGVDGTTRSHTVVVGMNVGPNGPINSTPSVPIPSNEPVAPPHGDAPLR